MEYSHQSHMITNNRRGHIYIYIYITYKSIILFKYIWRPLGFFDTPVCWKVSKNLIEGESLRDIEHYSASGSFFWAFCGKQDTKTRKPRRVHWIHSPLMSTAWASFEVEILLSAFLCLGKLIGQLCREQIVQLNTISINIFHYSIV